MLKSSNSSWHEWPATVASRSAGRLCGECKKSGFRPEKPGSLYLVKGVIEGKRVIQVGISNFIERRLKEHRKSGFNKTLVILDFPIGTEAMNLERKLINLMKDESLQSYRAQGILFDGASEAFCLENAGQVFLNKFINLLFPLPIPCNNSKAIDEVDSDFQEAFMALSSSQLSFHQSFRSEG